MGRTLAAVRQAVAGNLDMRPNLSAHHLADQRPGNSEAPSDSGLALAASGVCSPNGKDIDLGQLRERVAFTPITTWLQSSPVGVATWVPLGMQPTAVAVPARDSVGARAAAVRLPARLATLGDLIGDVAPLGRSEQMRRAHASGHVAGVTHHDAGRDGAVCQFLYGSVSRDGATVGLTSDQCEQSVPKWMSTPGPEPAVTGLIDMGPEAFQDGAPKANPPMAGTTAFAVSEHEPSRPALSVNRRNHCPATTLAPSRLNHLHSKEAARG